MENAWCSPQKLHIECGEYESRHPHCPHGPTLLFCRKNERNETIEGYYACAAHRDRNQCGYYLPMDQVTQQKLQRRYKIDTEPYREKRALVLYAPRTQTRYFCLDCDMPLLQVQLSVHVGKHHHVRTLSWLQIKDPTQFLPPLDNDKVQAQYFFDQKSLRFFAKCFEELQISKVICMGVPRLHAYLRQHYPEMRSFLLDFDYRFYYFFDDNSYAWYNMCNNHFFDEKQENEFYEFLKCAEDQQVLIFTDPPFGCRTEPIANTLRSIIKVCNVVNKRPHQPLPIFWIFPYFSEHYIREVMPEMEMCDYKVNYTNHESYNNGLKGRKEGSPVRLFTNVPLDRIHLPIEEQYKYCSACCKYTALENQHCHKCHECPSKNGATYRHCARCGLCVKPSYVHCNTCRRCTQVEGHQCDAYQAKQRCWICRQRGHTERNCSAWQDYCLRTTLFSLNSSTRPNSEIITCLLCDGQGHNELKCKRRSEYLEEETFLGITKTKFRF